MNYANRGMTFESYIEYVNARYKSSGIAVIEKQNTKFIPIRNRKGQVVSCKVEEKATVDFVGRYLNIPIAIEAKHTTKNRIAFSEVKNHQANYLNAFTFKQLGFGAVIVSFNMDRFFLVPWSYWNRCREQWIDYQKSGIKPCVETGCYYGNEWKTTGMASISADEMDPSWEIKGNGMPYLNNVATCIKQLQK